MRPSTPRISPLEADQWDADAAEVMQGFVERGSVFNIFKTMANHPELLRRWLVFANHVLGKSSLSARDREILILRIGYLCRAEYEWAQHVVIGRRAGLSEAEVRAIAEGPTADALDARERLLLQATDELHREACISDSTWAALSEHYDTRQLMDIVFAVGQYNLVSMALNSFGVELDPGLKGFAETLG
jgi:4-carboxymuconolactone decarboxylase